MSHFSKEFIPFEKRGGVSSKDWFVLDVEATHDCTTHQRTTAGGGDEERHSALLHGAATLPWAEVAAVVLGLSETFVELSCRRFPFDSNQGHLAVMEQVIQFQQTIAKWVFDLELRPAGFWGNAKIIEQWPDHPVAVFDVIVAGRGEQLPHPTIRLHGTV